MNAWSWGEDFLEGKIFEGEGESTDGEVTVDADSGAGGSESSGKREGKGAARATRAAIACLNRRPKPSIRVCLAKCVWVNDIKDQTDCKCLRVLI